MAKEFDVDNIISEWYLQKDTAHNAFAATYNFLYIFLNAVPQKEALLQKMKPNSKGEVSLQVISDVLKFYGVENLSVKIPQAKVNQIKLPSLALIKTKDQDAHECIIVKTISADKIAFLNPRLGWVIEPLNIFFDKWDGYLIMPTVNKELLRPGEMIFDSNEFVSNQVLTIHDNFLTKADCDKLIDLSESNFKRSQVTSGYSDGIIDDEQRKSYSALLAIDDEPFLNGLYELIAKKFKFRTSQFEYFQCVKYNGGDFFDYHHDVLKKDANGDEKLKTRRYTLLIYLNDSFKGGETAFPLLGIRVRPKSGCAILFENLQEDGNILKESLHAGLPVLEGTKYALNLWVHQSDFSRASRN
jgi:hypothetical protein